MNDRQRAILGMADWYLQHLDARLAQLPAPKPTLDPNRCRRVTCGAELGPWERGVVAGVRWRQCTRCHYREQTRFDFELYRRVLAARRERANGQ